LSFLSYFFAINSATRNLHHNFYYRMYPLRMYVWKKYISICFNLSVRELVFAGIVIRLWLHREGEPDHVVTVWGVYFSGLVYLGPKLSLDPAVLNINTIVFHMHGGYFTAFECFKEAPLKIRNTTVTVNAAEAQPSYNVNLLLRYCT